MFITIVSGIGVVGAVINCVLQYGSGNKNAAYAWGVAFLWAICVFIGSFS